MRIHSIEHEPFEGLANISDWAIKKGHSVTRTMMFRNEEQPDTEAFDWLIIMGGSMNIYEEEKYPWLKREKKFIRSAISDGKIVLGICLGAQMLADVLGGKVKKNEYAEVGWFPIRLSEHAFSGVFRSFPSEFTAFQWHQDTFTMPPRTLKFASSEACENQAFQIGRLIGLQFHLEYSRKSISHMIDKCGYMITDGKYVQKPEEIIANFSNVDKTEKILELLLDNIEMEYG